MSTYARNENGRLTDICYGESLASAVDGSFAPGYVAGKTWVSVPDGAFANATVIATDQDGNVTAFTNPTAPAISPKILSKTAFMDLAVKCFGGGLVGMARFQAIMDACAASTGAIKFCFSRYEAADTFAKDQVKSFTDIMEGASIMTLDEQASVMAAWPANGNG